MQAFKCKDPAGGPGLQRGQERADDADYAAQVLPAQECKLTETLRAEFAIAGLELLRGAGQALFVRRWGLSLELPDLDAARRWLERATGRRAA
jgi:hypothetical protein